MYVANLVAVLWRERQKLVSKHVEEKASSAVQFCKKATKGIPTKQLQSSTWAQETTWERWCIPMHFV